MSFRFRVYVSKKGGVFDPEAEVLKKSLIRLGFENLTQINVGRFFDVEIEEEDKQGAFLSVKKIADEVLTNPIIEDNRIEEI